LNRIDLKGVKLYLFVIGGDVKMAAEEYGIVLDYMPTGKSSAAKTEPLAQVIGKDSFTLLEVVPKPGISLTIGEEVYVGKDDRPKVELVKGRIAYKDLTSNSLSELEDIIEEIVLAQKEKFLNFFNTSRAISLYRHQLELLPGLGKKNMLAILDEREKKPFASFEEISQRVKGVSDAQKMIVRRIVEELEGIDTKHYLFVRPPSEPRENRFNRFSNQNRGYPPRRY
jgi:putative nucleotide binding protein